LATAKRAFSYDDFCKKGILQHLQDIKPAVMTVGGWFDAEDLYGPLNTYHNRETSKIIILLLWGHGVMEIGQEMELKLLLET
jgi:predicted acyl esterase